MHILVTGASGFIGSQIVTALLHAGHQVTCCVRNISYTKNLFPDANVLPCDFNNDTEMNDWLPRLKNIDVVINTVGIFYHPQKKIIWRIHYETPRALFDACVKARVKKIIHISALGVDQIQVDYAKSKKAADDYLGNLAISSVILRPSVVYGIGSYGGTSLFRGLAGLPGILPLPGKGEQKLQPIYLPDLAQAIVNLVDTEKFQKVILTAVGEKIISLKTMLPLLRRWLGFPRALLLYIPFTFLRVGALFGNLIPNSTINTTAINMLMQNNIAKQKDSEHFFKTIGFIPKNFNEGLFNQPSTVQDHWHARLYFVKPLLQMTLAFLWIFTAICSAFIFPKTTSYQWLAAVGISHAWQSFFLYGASLIDGVIGLALIFNFQVRKFCLLQILIILLYTVIITLKLPYFWLEPFGPITKNLPLLVAIYILYILESHR